MEYEFDLFVSGMISCQKGSDWCYRQGEEQLNCESGNGFYKKEQQSSQFT